MEKRDTEDRRRLRALPKLAVALELFVGIGEWNAELLRGLEACCCAGTAGVRGDLGCEWLFNIMATSIDPSDSCAPVCIHILHQ